MLGIKKLKWSLVAVLMTTGFISHAQAIVPDSRLRQHGGWYAEVEGFDARVYESLFSDLPVAVSDIFVTIPATATTDEIFTSHQKFHHFDPRERWGWRAVLGYDFPSCNCCSYGFSLEYTHYNRETRRRLENFISPNFAPALSFGQLQEVGSGYTDADAKLDFRYNTLDLLGHSNRTFCNCLDVQFFGGARYLNLKEDFHDHLFVSPDLIDDVIDHSQDFSDDTIRFHNCFNGVGPRIGINTFYQFTTGFGLVVEAAGNLIFGDAVNSLRQFETETIFLTSTITEKFFTSVDNPIRHRRIVVPGLSGKVGLAYRGVFCNCSSLVIEAGYRGDKYFGVAQDSSFVQFDNSGFNLDKDATHHDFSIAGPYISVSFHV